MGFWQKAYETYEHHAHLAGVSTDSFKEPLAPVAHNTTLPDIVITINHLGEFVKAALPDEKTGKIVIPVTEASAGRTNGAAPHPLCDNLGYIAPDDIVKHNAYVNQLTDWAESQYGHPILRSILAYVKAGTVLTDLAFAGIPVSGDEFVCWAVVDSDDKDVVHNCWTTKELYGLFYNYYREKKSNEKPIFCMVTGETTIPANMHIKGVVPIHGNAKLISAQDTTNFVYRGRFTAAEQAFSVGYEASQKTHNALKWLVANQGVVIGGRAFVFWNPEGKRVPSLLSPLASSTSEAPIESEENYQKELWAALHGYKNQFSDKDIAVFASFDAATTGRLSVTSYNEIHVPEMLEKLLKWDSTCCWDGRYGISSPSLPSIVNCAFGTERKGQIEVDENLMKRHFPRLLSCRLEGTAIPYDIVQAIAAKTMRPQAYDSQRGYLQFVACAVVRKYYIDQYNKEYAMSLEKDKKDISYQYGRLLAVLEKAERDTYRKDEGREPNAIRLQSTYCVRPAQTAKAIIEQVKIGYYHKLKKPSRAFYEMLIGEILSNISDYSESERNAPLTETYILGYYLQKNALYTKHETNNQTEENEDE